MKISVNVSFLSKLEIDVPNAGLLDQLGGIDVALKKASEYIEVALKNTLSASLLHMKVFGIKARILDAAVKIQKEGDEPVHAPSSASHTEEVHHEEKSE